MNHPEFLQEFSRIYLMPHRDDAGRQMWRDCKAAFGERLRTALVPEEMKDVGDLAEKAASPAQTFAKLVGEASKGDEKEPLCVWGLFFVTQGRVYSGRLTEELQPSSHPPH